MIPRGVLLVVLERLGYAPNDQQRILAEVDAEMADVSVDGDKSAIVDERRQEELDPFVCPLCGGTADNGHDRGLPPAPYVCTKCEVELL